MFPEGTSVVEGAALPSSSLYLHAVCVVVEGREKVRVPSVQITRCLRGRARRAVFLKVSVHGFLLFRRGCEKSVLSCIALQRGKDGLH